MSASQCPKCKEVGDIDSFDNDPVNCQVIWFMLCQKCEVQWDVFFCEGEQENAERLGE